MRVELIGAVVLFTSVLLALLAVALAWPVPVALAKARWPDATPGVALVLWQAVALTGVLSMLSALVTAGLSPFGAHLFPAALVFIDAVVRGAVPRGTTLPALLCVSAAALISLHLAINLVVTVRQVRRQRRRHIDLLLLLSKPMVGLPGTRLLETQTPVAYCVPKSARSVTVLSAGLLGLLGPEEVGGVIAHERAHLAQRHSMVIVAFRAWGSALPWLQSAQHAQDAVGVLTEMLADDRARRVASAEALAHAIDVVVGAEGATATDARRPDRPPRADLAAVGRRIARLRQPVVAPPVAMRHAALLVSIALVLAPALLLLLPGVGLAFTH